MLFVWENKNQRGRYVYKNKANEYVSWINGFLSGKEGHAGHIIRNLAEGIFSLIDLHNVLPHAEDRIQDHLEALATYKQLLEENEEFRNGEVDDGIHGYFHGEIPSSAGDIPREQEFARKNPTVHYVREAAKRLAEKS